MSLTTAAENPYAGQGPVLLDIGGDIGALVVAMPARLDGVEVEIRPAEDPVVDDHGAARHDHAGPGHRHHPHVAVVARPTAGGVVHSLVYGQLATGRYRLHRLPDGESGPEVEVLGGRVTEASWPAAGS